jgi:hypothetical protein
MLVDLRQARFREVSKESVPLFLRVSGRDAGSLFATGDGLVIVRHASPPCSARCGEVQSLGTTRSEFSWIDRG